MRAPNAIIMAAVFNFLGVLVKMCIRDSLKEGISKEECEKIVATFKEVGATVEVK